VEGVLYTTVATERRCDEREAFTKIGIRLTELVDAATISFTKNVRTYVVIDKLAEELAQTTGISTLSSGVL